MEANSLDIYANGWGVTDETIVEISQWEWDMLLRFREAVQDAVVTDLNEREVHWDNKQGDWMRASVRSLQIDRGGNAWNTANAIHKVLRTVDPRAAEEELRFHAFRNPKFQQMPFHTVLRDVEGEVKMRVAYVIKGPNGDDPMYWSLPPAPVETGTLPDAQNVLISSSGPDVYEEILAHCRKNPKGKVFLAPGSAQVKRGIPMEVLERIHLLSCNRDEAAALAQYLEPRDEKMSWTPGNLLAFFRDVGLPELRITDGAKGVHSLSEGKAFHMAGFDREKDSIQEAAKWLFDAGVATAKTFKHPNANGCGDTRLGVELGMTMAGRSLQESMRVANFMAALKTFIPGPNIGAVPDEVIGEIMDSLSTNL